MVYVLRPCLIKLGMNYDRLTDVLNLVYHDVDVIIKKGKERMS